MAVVVDKANLLYEEMSKSLTPVRDVLILAGFYYLAKKAIKWTFSTCYAVKVFGLSRIWPRNYKKEYGPWAVVTGCTRGIGLCYARELAQKGLNIVLVGRSAERLAKVANDIEKEFGVQTQIVEVDFSDGRPIYKKVENALQNVDIGILVNNVGVLTDHPMYFTEVSEAKLWDLINVNVAAATHMTRIVLPGMEHRGRGAIVNISSSVSTIPMPIFQPYSATKAYMDYMSMAISYEVASSGVTVQVISPGAVCTDMVAFSEAFRKPSLSVPTPETFAHSALATLGFSRHTSGYWAHGLSIIPYGIFSREIMTRLIIRLFKQCREEAIALKAKKD